MGLPMVIKVMGPQLPIRLAVGEHMEGTDHDRVSHRNDGAFLPATGGQAVI
jgi:hypothetical protein